MLEKVIEILSEFAEKMPEKVTEDTTLVADIGLSSLDVINVVVVFEDEFDIEIPDEDISNFSTVGDIAEYLKKFD